MECTTNDQMAAWLASGGAGLAKTIIAMDDQGMELQAAMLTRSPMTQALRLLLIPIASNAVRIGKIRT